MASVNFLVADGAVAEARGCQIMECRRRHSSHDSAGIRHRKIGVTFQAHEPHFLANEHLWICRPMWHMAALAAFFAHRRMLESEGSALITVALETARLVGTGHPEQARLQAAVWIVAIDARHGIFGNAMFERLRERGFHIDMAAFALGIDRGGLTGNRSIGTMRVDRVALHTANGVPGVTGFEASRNRWLVAMTSHTGAIDLGRR